MSYKLKYSLTIEATKDPNFYCFYSPDLDGFTGAGVSAQDCVDKARDAIDGFISTMVELGLKVPAPNLNPKLVMETARKEPTRNQAHRSPTKTTRTDSCGPTSSRGLIAIPRRASPIRKGRTQGETMTSRKIRSDARVGSVEKSRGLPSGTIRTPSGRDARSDKKIGTIRQQSKKK